MNTNVFTLDTDIGLEPEAIQHPLDGNPETFINADGVIALAKYANTDAGRRVYRAYRKRKAELKRDHPSLEDVELRQRAILDVLPVRRV